MVNLHINDVSQKKNTVEKIKKQNFVHLIVEQSSSGRIRDNCTSMRYASDVQYYCPAILNPPPTTSFPQPYNFP